MNIGAGETYVGYLVKSSDIIKVDSLIKDSVPIEELVKTEYLKRFKYRYLNEEESTVQNMRGWLKPSYKALIFTSDITIQPNERDKVMLEGGRILMILQEKPVVSNGMFFISKKPPHIIVLQ